MHPVIRKVIASSMLAAVLTSAAHGQIFFNRAQGLYTNATGPETVSADTHFDATPSSAEIGPITLDNGTHYATAEMDPVTGLFRASSSLEQATAHGAFKPAVVSGAA